MGKKAGKTGMEAIASILSRDEDFLQGLYRDTFPMVKNLVLQGQGQESDAWDVFQETMIVLFRKAQEPSFELTSKLSTYIVGIARLIWLKKREKNRITLLTNDISQAYMDDESLMVRAGRERLFREKLDEMGEQCKRILTLFFQKIKMSEIASQMNFASAEVARITKFRCTKKLMSLIQNDQNYQQLKA